VTIPVDNLRFEFVKSSGPGGQAVNKRSTKAVLNFKISSASWLPDLAKQTLKQRFVAHISGADSDDFQISSQKYEMCRSSAHYMKPNTHIPLLIRYRSQSENRVDVISKLRVIVDEAVSASVGIPSKAEKQIAKIRKAKDRQKRKAKKTAADLAKLTSSQIANN